MYIVRTTFLSRKNENYNVRTITDPSNPPSFLIRIFSHFNDPTVLGNGAFFNGGVNYQQPLAWLIPFHKFALNNKSILSTRYIYLFSIMFFLKWHSPTSIHFVYKYFITHEHDSICNETYFFNYKTLNRFGIELCFFLLGFVRR